MFHRETRCDWVEDGARLENARIRRIGTLVVERQIAPLDDPTDTIPRWCERLRREGLELLPWNGAATQLRARIQLLHTAMPEAGFPDQGDAALLTELEDWLGPYLAGITRMRDLERLDLAAILHGRLEWRHQQQLEREAPARIAVPSGSAHRVDYSQDPPVLAVKLQELFGQTETPCVAGGRVPVMLHLLSPAGRPVQVTQDLRSFWENGYPEVRRELKGRYPRHPWPEDPLERARDPACEAALSRAGGRRLAVDRLGRGASPAKGLLQENPCAMIARLSCRDRISMRRLVGLADHLHVAVFDATL